MPVPKDGAGQVSPPVPIGQDNPPIIGMTHHHTICSPTQRVHLSSVLLIQPHGDLFGDVFGAGMAAEVSLRPRRAHGHLSCFGKGFLATGRGARTFPQPRLIGLIGCSGPTESSLLRRSSCSQHPMEPPHDHGPLLMRDRHNRGGFCAGIWPLGPPAAPTAEMWGFGAPQGPTELLLHLWAAPLPSWRGQQAPVPLCCTGRC